MKVLRGFALVALMAFGAILIAGCGEKASAEQIDAMCQHYLKLKHNADQDMFEKCKADALKEGPLKEKVDCRLKATNTDEFWNKCM